MPMRLHTEFLPNTTNEIALLYGPIVLAGELGTNAMPRPFAATQTQFDRQPDPAAPMLVTTAADLLEHIKPVSGQPLTFRTSGIGRPEDVTLEAFYKLHRERFSVYWKLISEHCGQKWKSPCTCVPHVGQRKTSGCRSRKYSTAPIPAAQQETNTFRTSAHRAPRRVLADVAHQQEVQRSHHAPGKIEVDAQAQRRRRMVVLRGRNDPEIVFDQNERQAGRNNRPCRNHPFFFVYADGLRIGHETSPVARAFPQIF